MKSINPRYFILFFIVTSSFYFIKIEGTSLYLFDLFFLIGLFAFPSKFLAMTRMQYLAILFFILSILTSLSFTLIENHEVNFTNATAVLLRLLQVIFCANFFFKNAPLFKNNTKSLFSASLTSIFVVSLGGLLLLSVWPERATAFNRYAGFLDNPNSIALYTVTSSAVVFGILKSRLLPTTASILTLILFSFASIYSLAMSGSNSGILLFLIVLLLYSASTLRSLAVIISAVILAALFSEFLKDELIAVGLWLQNNEFPGLQRSGIFIIQVTTGYGLDDLGSYSYRQEISNYLFNHQFSSLFRVLFGLGAGQSASITMELDGNSVTVHNFFLWTFLEFGVFGLISFWTMLFLVFRRFSWSMESTRMSAGFILASSATPVLYLPFYWIPLLSGLTAFSALRADWSSKKSPVIQRTSNVNYFPGKYKQTKNHF